MLITHIMKVYGLFRWDEISSKAFDLFSSIDTLEPITAELPHIYSGFGIQLLEQIPNLAAVGADENGHPIPAWRLERDMSEAAIRFNTIGLHDAEAARADVLVEIRLAREALWKEWHEGKRNPSSLAEVRQSLALEVEILGLKKPTQINHLVGRFEINPAEALQVGQALQHLESDQLAALEDALMTVDVSS